MKKLLLSIFALSVSLLSAANISLNGVEYTIDTLSMYPAGPGSTFYELRMFKVSDGKGRIDAFLLSVDTRNPYVGIEQVLGTGKIIGTERPSKMAERSTTTNKIFFAGANGDFFVTQGDVGLPVSTTIVNDEYAHTPVANRTARRLGAIDADGRGITAIQHAISMKLILADNTTLDIAHANYKRQENELVIYNAHNGTTTGTNAYGTEVQIELLEGEKWQTTGTMRARVTKVEDQVGSMPLDKNHAVLSGHGTMATELKKLSVGDELTLQFEISFDGNVVNISQAIGSDNYTQILVDGAVAQSGFWNELHPRTGFGVSQSRDTTYMLVVDGRGVSAGCTTKVLAEIMQHYGAYNAVNWDGGGSSCLYVRPMGPMNNGSDGTERACGNGMFAVANVPGEDNTVASIAPTLPMYTLPPFSMLQPKFLGYNQYGVLVDTDVQGVYLTCEEDMGKILENGAFLYAGTKSGVITAHLGDATAQIEVRLSDAPVAFRLDSVLCDGKHAYVVENRAIIGNDTITIANDILTWTSSNPEVATVNENGEINGVSNGYAMVVGTMAGFEDSIKVHVEIPTTREQLWCDFRELDFWTVKGAATLNPALVIPENEEEPAKISFTYKSPRSPYVQITTTDSVIYSRPEKLIIPFATDAIVKEFIVLIRPDNAKQSKTLRFSGLSNEGIVEVNIEENLGDDVAIYPLHFEGLKFTLDTSTEKGDRYITLPGVTQIYDVEDVQTGVEKVGNKLIVEKVMKNGVLYIQQADGIYTILGEKVK